MIGTRKVPLKQHFYPSQLTPPWLSSRPYVRIKFIHIYSPVSFTQVRFPFRILLLVCLNRPFDSNTFPLLCSLVQEFRNSHNTKKISIMNSNVYVRSMRTAKLKQLYFDEECSNAFQQNCKWYNFIHKFEITGILRFASPTFLCSHQCTPIIN